MRFNSRNNQGVDSPFPTDPNLPMLQSTPIDPAEERKNKKLDNAYKLLFRCIWFFGGVYVLNSFLVPKNSDATDAVLELGKTIVLTLLGFLYGKTDE